MIPSVVAAVCHFPDKIQPPQAAVCITTENNTHTCNVWYVYIHAMKIAYENYRKMIPYPEI